MAFLYKGVEVLQVREEFEQLLDLVKEENVKTILQIGFHHGGSHLLFDEAIGTGGYIISIDRWEKAKDYAKIIDPMLRNQMTLIEYNSRGKQAIDAVKFLLQGYTTQDGVYKAGYGKAIDLLYIDGNHYGDYPITDYINYKEFVKPGGLIVFDDISFPDVNRAWITVREGHRYKEIFGKKESDLDWNGQGIMWTDLTPEQEPVSAEV